MLTSGILEPMQRAGSTDALLGPFRGSGFPRRIGMVVGSGSRVCGCGVSDRARRAARFQSTVNAAFLCESGGAKVNVHVPTRRV